VVASRSAPHFAGYEYLFKRVIDQKEKAVLLYAPWHADRFIFTTQQRFA
jgi:hypothetical protein